MRPSSAAILARLWDIRLKGAEAKIARVNSERARADDLRNAAASEAEAGRSYVAEVAGSDAPNRSGLIAQRARRLVETLDVNLLVADRRVASVNEIAATAADRRALATRKATAWAELAAREQRRKRARQAVAADEADL